MVGWQVVPAMGCRRWGAGARAAERVNWKKSSDAVLKTRRGLQGRAQGVKGSRPSGPSVRPGRARRASRDGRLSDGYRGAWRTRAQKGLREPQSCARITTHATEGVPHPLFVAGPSDLCTTSAPANVTLWVRCVQVAATWPPMRSCGLVLRAVVTLLATERESLFLRAASSPPEPPLIPRHTPQVLAGVLWAQTQVLCVPPGLVVRRRGRVTHASHL